MSTEEKTEKVLVFNPGGFFLKLLFAIGIPIWMFWDMEEFGFAYIVENILGFLLIFVLMYAIATLFGFAVNVTGNYIIALIVFGILLVAFFALFGKIEEKLAGLGSFGEIIVNILLIAVLVWPFIIDVRKAIIYFKSTV